MRPLLIALLLTLVAVLRAPAEDWPALHGPNRDGHSKETGLNWKWPKEGPPALWSKNIGAGFAGVAVAKGTVFLFHRVENDEILAAIDATNGKEKWVNKARTRYVDDFRFDDGPRCVPVLSEAKAFLIGADGDFRAVDIATGQTIWERNLRIDFDVPKGFFGFGSAPIPVEGKLLVNVGGKGAGIVAFDPGTGKEIWKAGSDPVSYSSPVPIEGGAAFFTRSGFLRVSAAGKVTHTFPWRPRLEASVNAASPVVRGNEVLVSTSYGTGAVLLKIDGEKLDEVWSNDKSISCHYNTPVLVGDFLYGIHGRQEGGAAKLRCVEWKTGEVKWSVDNFGCATLVAVDGGLLAVAENGDIVRFEASSNAYKELAKARVLDGVVRAAPALSDGKLFLRNETKLVCLKLN